MDQFTQIPKHPRICWSFSVFFSISESRETFFQEPFQILLCLSWNIWEIKLLLFHWKLEENVKQVVVLSEYCNRGESRELIIELSRHWSMDTALLNGGLNVAISYFHACDSL